jgi:glycine cleavage system H protein
MIPDDLLYTTDHEWIRRTGDIARIGVTDFAQQALGDIVYVSPPELGAVLVVGGTLGEIESTKSVSDVYAPVAGEVIGRNESLDEQPELVNADPYGEGWLVEIRVSDDDGAALLSPAEYAAHVEAQG